MEVIIMAKSMNVADYIILVAKKLNKPVSNLQLQKIMYFLNVIHLLKFDEPLITNDHFEKWDYGPVLRDVYEEYSCNGSLKINKVSEHLFLVKENNTFKVKRSIFNEDDLSKKDKIFISNNLKKFIDINPFDLVRQSHKEPQWKDRSNVQYDDKRTLDYYSKKDNQFWN